jgi:hypothetical protein
MNSFINDEYRSLLDEYTSMLNNAIVEGEFMNIETKEKNRVKVRLNRDGWQVMESNVEQLKDSTFETAEALLMAASPEFRRLWNDKLTEKLFAVKQNVEQQEQKRLDGPTS